MTAHTRDAMFISHADPEDNALSVWLGPHLTAAGNEAWTGVLRLLGAPVTTSRASISLAGVRAGGGG